MNPWLEINNLLCTYIWLLQYLRQITEHLIHELSLYFLIVNKCIILSISSQFVTEGLTLVNDHGRLEMQLCFITF